MAKGFALSIVMKAVDKATAPIRAVAKAADKAVAPFKRLQTVNNKVRITWDRLGGSKISGSLKNVGTKVGSLIGKTAKFVGGLIALQGAIGGTVGAIYKVTRLASDYGDTAWKVSQKIGMNVEAWQEMAHAGEMSGVESEALSKGMIKLNKNIIEAAMGNKTLASWFKRVGVSFVDASGKARDVEDVFMDLSEVFGKQKDGAKKTAAAMALMGKSGADMIPMLNSGKKGLQEMRQEARDLGIVMDEKTAKASEAFNDNFERMTKVVKGLMFTVGSGLIPIFNDIVLSVRAWLEQNRELIKSKIKEWVEDLRKRLPELKEKIFALVDGIKVFAAKVLDLVETLGGFKNVMKAVGVYMLISFTASVFSAIQALMLLGTTLLATPAGWILLAIAAAILAVYYAIKKWDSIWSAIKQLGDSIKVLWDQMTTGFSAWVQYITDVFSKINLYDIGIGILNSLWEGMKSVWGNVTDWFSGILKTFKVNISQPSSNGLPMPVTPIPLFPNKPEPFKPMGPSSAYGNGNNGQPAKASVLIDFANVPKGTKINSKSDRNTDLGMQVKMGPAMATP